jgi:hypothetical protein
VSFGGVIVIITKMRVFDFGGGVDAGDGVDFGPVTALAAVILEAAGYAVGLGKQYNIATRCVSACCNVLFDLQNR